MIGMSDLFRVSLRQVTRQRGFGVILSIALGITAFIALSVLGREVRHKIGQDMVLMGGVNAIQVFMTDRQYPGQPVRGFYPDTIAALRRLAGVDVVSCNLRGAKIFPIQAGDERTLYIEFVGVDQYFAQVYSLNLVAGRFFDAADISGRKRVCVLGSEAAIHLFKSAAEAPGKLLFLDRDVFEIIGVASGVMLGSWSQGGFLPYTTMMDRNWVSPEVNRLFVRAVTWEDVASLVRRIPAVVKEYQQAPHLVAQAQDEQLERIQSTFVWVEILLWLGIAASLLLGGFGIWSGTYTAVRARTREVGLKKAMGASDADIMAQFLAEALCKSVAGGILGIALGCLAVFTGTWLLASTINYPLLAASGAGSILFSAFIGVAGGILPALKASRMDVVSALRFE